MPPACVTGGVAGKRLVIDQVDELRRGRGSADVQAALLVGQGLHRLGIGAVAHLAIDVRQVLEDLRMPLDRRTIKEGLAGRLVLSAPRQEHAQFVRRAIVPRIDREGRLFEGQRLRLSQERVAFDAAAEERLQPAEVVNRVSRFGNATDGRGELRRRVRIIELQGLQACDAPSMALFQNRRDVRGRQRDRVGVAGRRSIGMAEIVRFAKGDRTARQRAAVKLRVVSGVKRVGDELQRGQKLAARRVRGAFRGQEHALVRQLSALQYDAAERCAEVVIRNGKLPGRGGDVSAAEVSALGAVEETGCTAGPAAVSAS